MPEEYDCEETDRERVKRWQICEYAIDGYLSELDDLTSRAFGHAALFFTDLEKGKFECEREDCPSYEASVGMSASLVDLLLSSNYERWGLNALKWMCRDVLDDRARRKELGKGHAPELRDEVWERMWNPATETELEAAFAEYDRKTKELRAKMRPFIGKWKESLKQ